MSTTRVPDSDIDAFAYVLKNFSRSSMYILETQGEKKIVPGVSPQFAMTKMDDDAHPECDIYVEDNALA